MKRTNKKVLQEKATEIEEIKRLFKNIKRRYKNVQKVNKGTGFHNPFLEKIKKYGGIKKLNYVGKGKIAIDNLLQRLQQLDTLKTSRVSSLKNTLKGRQHALSRMKDLNKRYGKKTADEILKKIDELYLRIMEEHPLLERKSEISTFIKNQIKVGLENGYSDDDILEKINNLLYDLMDNGFDGTWDDLDDIKW